MAVSSDVRQVTTEETPTWLNLVVVGIPVRLLLRVTIVVVLPLSLLLRPTVAAGVYWRVLEEVVHVADLRLLLVAVVVVALLTLVLIVVVPVVSVVVVPTRGSGSRPVSSVLLVDSGWSSAGLFTPRAVFFDD